MRAPFIIGSVAVAAAACVAVAEHDAATQAESDSGPSALPIAEGGTEKTDAGIDATQGATCSKAGWCPTVLPDIDLVVRDFWPLAERVFAIVESPTLGVKLLEWTDADAKWSYIDDGSQNEDGRGRWAGRLWVPSANEIYAGVSPNWVFHGVRAAPGEPWSWERNALGTANTADPSDGYPAYWARDGLARNIPSLGVWGTSRGDVYAWFKNRIYRWSSADGNDPQWALEYTAADTDVASERMYFFAAAGTSPDELWFAGTRTRVRSACALLVRKTGAGFERIADGIAAAPIRPCKARPGSLLIGGAEGWLTDLQATSADELLGLKGGRDVVKITREGSGYSVSTAPIPLTVSRTGLNSLSLTDGELWLGGAGLVVRGEGVWDGGGYAISQVSLDRSTATNPMINQVRGVSSFNLWAMGYRHALRKTTTH